jgi:hypothetical protein
MAKIAHLGEAACHVGDVLVHAEDLADHQHDRQAVAAGRAPRDRRAA